MSTSGPIIMTPPPPPPPPKRVYGVPFVHNVATWHRWWSMRWLISATIAQTLLEVWPRLPAEWVSPMPGWLTATLGYFVLVALPAAAVSRVIQQAAPK